MDYDYLVFIGRFEPFHNGHLAVARYGLGRARKLIFLVGSADTPRTIKNPWTVAERAVMIQSALDDANDRLIIRPLHDHLYNESHWIADVQRSVADSLKSDGGKPDAPKAVAMLSDNLNKVPARVISPAGRARLPERQAELEKFLRLVTTVLHFTIEN